MRKTFNLGGVILIAVAFSACGGSEDAKVADDSKPTASTTSTPTTTEPEHPQRPEGGWAVMRWEAEHGGEGGYASVSKVLYSLEPTCKSGPCDLEVTGAGVNGSYLPAEMPLRDGDSSGQVPKEVFTMKWNEADGTYSYSNTESSQCFAKDGAVVDYGFDLKTTGVLKFTAGSDSAAAAMHGTREMVGTPTPEGAAAGCEAFSEKFVMAAAPVGAFAENPPSLAGEYWASLWIAENVPPDANRPKGAIVTFDDPITIAGEDNSYLLSSWFAGMATLAKSGDGIWNGSATSSTETCTESASGGEYDSSEKWENMQIVALTASGKPVISANYSLVAEPNPAGVISGCEKSLERGLAFLVPKDAS